jgi:hypothetical protein
MITRRPSDRRERRSGKQRPDAGVNMKENSSQSDRRGGRATDYDDCLLGDCTNVVYGAIIGHPQMLETNKRYPGNSRHLAQLLTRMVCDTLS